MTTPRYLLVALPLSIAKSHDRPDALEVVNRTLSGATSEAQTYSFPIPDLKIGTLDALVQQADELAKLDGNIDGAVRKAADVLQTLAPGQESQNKVVNEKHPSHYLRSFCWNKARYRTDFSIAQIIATLTREITSLDSDIKSQFSTWQTARSNLLNVQRKTTGNLTTRSLAPLLNRKDVLTSEYLETLFIVVPKPLAKDWIKSYETLSPMVVPRSSNKLAEDEEYILYNVVVFKKHSGDFIHAARQAKFTPRDFTWSDNARQNDETEAAEVEADERRAFEGAMRLARTGYGELVQAWAHAKALRVFVESVLRYGLPLEFVSAIVEVRNGEKGAKKCKSALDEAYGYLGGNAFGRDKKGRIRDDVNEGMAGLTLGGAHDDYTAFCYFEFEVA